MRLQTLAETGLGIDQDEINSVFAPFVTRRFTNGDDADWCREIARRKRRILGKAMERAALAWRPGNRRCKELVLEEYEAAWESRSYDYYNVDGYNDDGVGPRPKPWHWGDKRLFALDTGATRFRQLFLSQIVERVEPTNVLEVGCGNGINLTLLACRFPEVQFAGVELTSSGCRVAKEFQTEGNFSQKLKYYAPLPPRDAGAFVGIDFIQGSATALPFPDGAFDLVCTVLSLEQMESVRAQALTEIVRVTRKYALMIEPFRDVNSAFWPGLYVFWRDYFRGSIDELRNFGLRPVTATSDFPQEAFLKTCLVLSEKT